MDFQSMIVMARCVNNFNKDLKALLTPPLNQIKLAQIIDNKAIFVAENQSILNFALQQQDILKKFIDSNKSIGTIKTIEFKLIKHSEFLLSFSLFSLNCNTPAEIVKIKIATTIISKLNLSLLISSFISITKNLVIAVIAINIKNTTGILWVLKYIPVIAPNSKYMNNNNISLRDANPDSCCIIIKYSETADHTMVIPITNNPTK